MEFQFDVNGVFRKDITVLVGKRGNENSPSQFGNERCIAEVVNSMGEASAKAQGLLSAITSYSRLNLNQDKLYILKGTHESKSKGVVIGILKTGCRRLYLNDNFGRQHEVEPLSVLDFYVHESRQKCGFGKKLFEFMLKEEGLQAWEVAIDRPSYKFLNFLKKNYGLTKCINQANHYVVFEEFFNTHTKMPQKSRFPLTCNAQLSFQKPSPLSDRVLRKPIPSTKPCLPDNYSLPLEEEGSSETNRPLTSDFAKDEKENTGLTEPQLTKGGTTSSNGKMECEAGSNGDGCRDKPGIRKGAEGRDSFGLIPEIGICHPQMNSLRTSSKYDPKSAIEGTNFPKSRTVGISSLATSGFGINGLGISSFRVGEDEQRRRFGNIGDSHKNGGYGAGPVGSTQQDLAPYLNMRQTRNGRRKSDITSPSYSPVNYNAAVSYSRHNLTGNHHVLQCTQPRSEALKPSQFSSQSKPKDNWRQFIT